MALLSRSVLCHSVILILKVNTMKVSISSRAYSKILLHASKYPHKAVCGVVIGHENSDSQIDVLDAVPLFHLSLGLAPMMEVALTQV